MTYKFGSDRGFFPSQFPDRTPFLAFGPRADGCTVCLASPATAPHRSILAGLAGSRWSHVLAAMVDDALSTPPGASRPAPPRPGQIERRTHDYTRHGTASL
jgi:hypothetical protein